MDLDLILLYGLHWKLFGEVIFVVFRFIVRMGEWR
jgi:hypothetical protein